MNNDSQSMESNNYLDDPLVIKKFSKNYLTSLNVYLDDKSFAKKISQLPAVKSATTAKFEKIVEKELELKKKRNNGEINKELAGGGAKEKEKETSVEKTKIKKNNLSTQGVKHMHVRYLILDPENRQIDLTNIEDNFEYNKKLVNPYKALLVEDSDKIKKQAIEQILDNALNREKKKERANQTSSVNLTKDLSTKKVNHVTEDRDNRSYLLNKYNASLPQLNYEEIKAKENFDNFMKVFKESCELNNLITVDQKIDYFVHLKTNMQSKKESPERVSKYPMRYIQTMAPNLTYKKLLKNSNQTIRDPSLIPSILKGFRNDDTSSPVRDAGNPNQSILGHMIEGNRKEAFAASRSRSLNLDVFYKYITDLKNKFKITEDAQSIKFWEFYYNELMIKVSSYKSQQKAVTAEGITLSYIEKIKQIINCKEISGDKVILRESEMTPDKFYYLVAKRIFDFRQIQHLNLSKNMLGDLGGCYLMYLIETYSVKLEYLNISYNKIGKQTCEYLTNIFHRNTLKLSALNIGGNNLGDKNFSEICVGISKNSYLTKLFTNENDLGKISATILGTILRYDKKIKVLDVSKNYFDDSIISYLLKGLISNVSLEVLFVNENNLTNRALRNFETTLSINTSLREIFIEKNKFTSKCYETVAEILNKNSYIEYISLAGNRLKMDVMDQVIELQKRWPAKIISKTDFYQTKLNSEDKLNFFEFI